MANFRVVDIIEQEDGGAIMEFEYDKSFSDFVKNHYGKKRCSKKMIENFVLEGLKNSIDKLEK